LLNGLCVAGILLFLNFFRLDLFRTLTRQTEEPVGIITFKYKAAQRRFMDRVLWDRLKKESPVYSGDLIRTADLSEATITFAGGTVIDLEENTLVRIRDDMQGFQVDIDGGGLNVASVAGDGLVLVSGENRAALEAGAAARAGVDGGGFLLQVTEGAASLTVNGERRTAAAGEVLGDAAAAFRPVALSPRPSARLLYPGEGALAVTFRWSRPAGREDPLRLEVAEDRAFTRIAFREDVAGNSAVVELGAGSYFWRIFSEGEGGASSFDTIPLKIIAAPAPVLIVPAESYTYHFRLRKPLLRFQWSELGDAAAYVLEAADNPRLDNPVFSREVRGTSLRTSEFGAGTWYWRVRPVFPAVYEGEAAEGSVGSFRVVQSGELGVPVLRAPADGAPVNIGRGNLYFSWQQEAEARSYTIRISARADLGNPLVDRTIQDNFYNYRAGEGLIKTGQYYWAVFQTDTEGNNSVPSPVRSFTALEEDLIQRAVFPPEGYRIGNTFLPDIRFTWKSNLPLETRFQVSSAADFSAPVIDEAAGSGGGESFQGRPLPEGRWYWRISARNQGGAVFQTPPRSFTVVSPLPAPLLTEPGQNGRMVVLEDQRQRFSWNPSPGAEYYEFKLYAAADRRRPVYETNFIEETDMALSMNAYPDGDYFWTVQGFASESARSTRITGLLAEGAFNARKIRPVRLDYPGSGETFPGLQAYLEPAAAGWSTADPVASSRFILSRNQDFSGPPLVDINNPPRRITLPRLRAGDYYWTIRAATADGFDISARTPRLIRILPIPPLPAAANRVPADGARVTGEDLRNRRIVFSWDAVPGATGYLFSLEGTDGSILIQEGPFAETRFTLEDLSILDLGNFVWRLEAVLTEPLEERREEDGEIFQRGEVGENRFTVEFIRPGVPDLRRPGVLYGRE
jgi:hypothetical protein